MSRLKRNAPGTMVRPCAAASVWNRPKVTAIGHAGAPRAPPRPDRGPWRSPRRPWRRRGGSGAACRHGRSARDPDVGIAEVAGDAGADPDRDPGLHEARRLLDMHLQEGVDRGGVEGGRAAPQRVRVAARPGDMRGEGAAVSIRARVERPVRQGAERRPAADIGDLEPDALLGADAHDGDVARRRQPERAQRRDGGEAGHHAGGPVEVAAVGHGVEMGADQDRRRGSGPGPASVM